MVRVAVRMPARFSRRRVLSALAGAGAASALAPWPMRGIVAAQEASRYFRIGTGASGGTYHPIGTTIANAISNPPGSRPCDRGGACGVPGLIASAQSTQGSLQNIEELRAERFESALVQADVAYWAFRGEGVYAGKPPLGELRLIATLYPEIVHLVVSKQSGIAAVGDLYGKRVSLGEQASGTRIHAEIVLAAHGLAPDDVRAAYLRPGEAADALRSERLDAFFFVAGAPTAAIASLAESMDIAVLPLAGAPIEPLRARYPFFTTTRLLGGEYRGVGEIPTLAVSTLWVVSIKVDRDLVYGITRALWHPNTKELLARGHPAGKRVLLDHALDSDAVPLHSGAERFYAEAGKLPVPRAGNGPANGDRKN